VIVNSGYRFNIFQFGTHAKKDVRMCHWSDIMACFVAIMAGYLSHLENACFLWYTSC
jgi:hypothetical protein